MRKYFICDNIIVYNAQGVSKRQMFLDKIGANMIFCAEGGLARMRDIVISIQNDLIAEAVIWGLEESGEFQPFKLLSQMRTRCCTNVHA